MDTSQIYTMHSLMLIHQLCLRSTRSEGKITSINKVIVLSVSVRIMYFLLNCHYNKLVSK